MLQDIDSRLLQQGTEALMKIQITYCEDTQTMLGITMAHVLAGQRHPHAYECCNDLLPFTDVVLHILCLACQLIHVKVCEVALGKQTLRKCCMTVKLHHVSQQGSSGHAALQGATAYST